MLATSEAVESSSTMDSQTRRPSPVKAVAVARVVAYGFVGAMMCFGIVPLALDFAHHSPLWRVVVGAVAFGGVAVAFVRLARIATRQPWQGRGRWETGVAVVVALLLPVLVDPAWQVLGFLPVAAVLMTLRPRYGLLVAAALLASSFVERLALHISGAGFLAVQDALTGLALAGIVVLAAFVAELHDARAELARMAVTVERTRIARDLHDTLGHNLSAIALKTDLAKRLLPADPDRTLAELVDVQTIARECLRDVRTVVKGYRRDSLVRELSGVQSVLVAAGVHCVVSAVPLDLPAPVEEVLAWTVREGATNLLRHSDATRCEVDISDRAGLVRLAMVNDGSRRAPTDTIGGNGLAGLTERLAPLCGQLTATGSGDGEFRLTVSIPRTPAGRSS